MTTFFINAEALTNGDAVECDGSPMRPGQWCVRVGGESLSYDEEKKNEEAARIGGAASRGDGRRLAALSSVNNAPRCLPPPPCHACPSPRSFLHPTYPRGLEARGELVGYAGVGLGTLGIVVFISNGITTRRGNR
ncbi:hypothetical protein OIE62_28280 [Streptomyces scopuliridis]|uniref:Uncharacterized protein n=1 Tax=Streptomyces scopuliridis TaxID=452529 RepID=A0ACD4ZHZ9_9ACTN|nr:hypothetical protein [Streptomyces scopuliridis]WSB97785.1 hypothetical protein OG835_12655 [Streptomyces scopuliridis]WSC08512.1 hypothetical protein OIE62_28280 [Streptomyces scopuliridis]